jgi:hypothetical protein
MLVDTPLPRVSSANATGMVALTSAATLTSGVLRASRRRNGHAAAAEVLAAHMDAAALNELEFGSGQTALDIAIHGGLPLATAAAAIRARGGLTSLGVKALLPLGAQLYWACRDVRADDALRLIGEGADVDFGVDAYGATPLMVASELGKLAIAQLLVNNGANVNVIDKTGHSALSRAADFGYFEIARLLADNGAKNPIPSLVNGSKW